MSQKNLILKFNRHLLDLIPIVGDLYDEGMISEETCKEWGKIQLKASIEVNSYLLKKNGPP